ATATDASGNTSPCSMPLMYIEDSNPPAAPTLVDTLPHSPSRSLAPKVRGTADANTQIVMFPTTDCTGTPLGMGMSDANGNFSVDITVMPGVTTQIAAIAKDAAGNASSCSGFAMTYVHNAQALGPPTITGSTPTSPSKTSTTPMLLGTSEASVM